MSSSMSLASNLAANVSRVPLLASPTIAANCSLDYSSGSHESLYDSTRVQSSSSPSKLSLTTSGSSRTGNNKLIISPSKQQKRPITNQRSGQLNGKVKTSLGQSRREQQQQQKSFQVNQQQVLGYQEEQGYQSSLYQEELSRMRERLFRLLSKVPIQVDTVRQKEFCSSPGTSASTPSGSSGASCSGSSSSNSQSRLIEREPLLIKYYNERSLKDILDLHFNCSLMRHNFEKASNSMELSQQQPQQPPENQFKSNDASCGCWNQPFNRNAQQQAELVSGRVPEAANSIQLDDHYGNNNNRMIIYSCGTGVPLYGTKQQQEQPIQQTYPFQEEQLLEQREQEQSYALSAATNLAEWEQASFQSTASLAYLTPTGKTTNNNLHHHLRQRTSPSSFVGSNKTGATGKEGSAKLRHLQEAKTSEEATQNNPYPREALAGVLASGGETVQLAYQPQLYNSTTCHQNDQFAAGGSMNQAGEQYQEVYHYQQAGYELGCAQEWQACGAEQLQGAHSSLQLEALMQQQQGHLHMIDVQSRCNGGATSESSYNEQAFYATGNNYLPGAPYTLDGFHTQPHQDHHHHHHHQQQQQI